MRVDTTAQFAKSAPGEHHQWLAQQFGSSELITGARGMMVLFKWPQGTQPCMLYADQYVFLHMPLGLLAMS